MIKINIDSYRKNIVDYAYTFLDKKYVWDSQGPEEFDCSGLTWYIFKELFNIDINKTGYGIGDTTKQMTSTIGNLKVYKEDDPNKNKYIDVVCCEYHIICHNVCPPANFFYWLFVFNSKISIIFFKLVK